MPSQGTHVHHRTTTLGRTRSLPGQDSHHSSALREALAKEQEGASSRARLDMQEAQHKKIAAAAKRAKRAEPRVSLLRRSLTTVRQRLRRAKAAGRATSQRCATLEVEVFGLKAGIEAQAEQHKAELFAISQRAWEDADVAQADLLAARSDASRAAQQLAAQAAKLQCAEGGTFDMACRIAQLEAALGPEAVAALGSPRPTGPRPASLAAIYVPLAPCKEGRPVINLTAAAGIPAPAKTPAAPLGVAKEDSPSAGSLASSPSSSSGSSSNSSRSTMQKEVVEEAPASVRDLTLAFEAGAFNGRKRTATNVSLKAEAEELALRFGSGVCGGGVAAAVRTLAPLGGTAGACVTRATLATAALQVAKRCAWAPPVLCLTVACAASDAVSEAAAFAAQKCAAVKQLLLQAWAAW